MKLLLTKKKFRENALDAVSRGITPSLAEIAGNMSDDEEVMELVMKGTSHKPASNCTIS